MGTLGCHAGRLGFSLNAAGAGLYAVTFFVSSPLEVWLEADNGSAHGVGSFYGAGVGLAAHCTHSWHI